MVHRSVLTKHSSYFEAAAKKCFAESEGVIRFEDIDPKYFALFLGVAYSYSSIVPHTAPSPAANPQAKTLRTPLRDYVEVYKLCDRFVCPTIADFMILCIDAAIGDGHRAMFHSQKDDEQQKWQIRDFADGYEVLELNHLTQKQIGQRMIQYFCEGVSYRAWEKWVEEIEDKPRFVAHVSRGFAHKLVDICEQRGKPKRKELRGP